MNRWLASLPVAIGLSCFGGYIPEQPKGQAVHSTAYCLTSQNASGRTPRFGDVAMRGVKFGTVYRVLNGPLKNALFTVADRPGRRDRTDFDIAFPGDCKRALRYGRQNIRIERVR